MCFFKRSFLGAFLFFNRDVTQRNDPNTVIRTIAYQIASYDRRIQATILAAIENTSNVCFLLPRVQFRKLVVESLRSIHSPLPQQPLVVVLDALDECGTPHDRKSLLAVLTEETVALAPFVRFVVTSRAEPDICCAFDSHSHIHQHELDTNSDTNMADTCCIFVIEPRTLEG